MNQPGDALWCVKFPRNRSGAVSGLGARALGCEARAGFGQSDDFSRGRYQPACNTAPNAAQVVGWPEKLICYDATRTCGNAKRI